MDERHGAVLADRFFAKRGVAKRLGQAGGTTTPPYPSVDLATLRRMSEIRTAIDTATGVLAAFPHVRGLDSDPAGLRANSDAGEALRSAINASAPDPDSLISIRQASSALVIEANEFLAPDGRVALAMGELDRRAREWADLVNRLDFFLAIDRGGIARRFQGVAAVADTVLVARRS